MTISANLPRRACAHGRFTPLALGLRRALPAAMATRFPWAFLVAATLMGLPAVRAAQDGDARLNDFFKRYLDEQFRAHPVEATRLGDHRFDALLDDLSAPARERWLARLRTLLQQLPTEVDYSRLTRDGQIDFEILRHDLEETLWLSENTRPFEEDPRVYGNCINDSVFLLLAQSTMAKETNVANCIARIAEAPKVLAAARQNLKHPPKPILETAIRQNRGAIGFFDGGILELAGETPQRDQLKAAGSKLATRLREYQTFLEGELMQRADGDWRLGKERFAKKLELELDAGLSADQVYAEAEKEFDRVEREMYVVARQLWSRYFRTKPLPTDDQAGRRSTIQQVMTAVSKEHGRPEDLLRDARATVERIKSFIRDTDFLRLPEPDRCQVLEMPEFKRGNSVAYMESAPPLDPNASSIYAVSPPPSDWDTARVESYLEEYNQHLLQILTIHEAYPGHYVQLEYSNRTPSPIRRVLQSGPYIEGWAVYTEQTMLDQGYGDGDLRLRLMQLKFYLRAVANAILDNRMHCSQIGDDEALKFLMEGAFQSEGEARLKLIRAKQSSVQLSTYFVGRMAHYRLRQQMERQLGDGFNLGRYHEAVIGAGSVPVKYLPELVSARLQQPR